MSPTQIRFEEEQQFREPWHWMLVLGVPVVIGSVLVPVLLHSGEKNVLSVVLLSMAVVTCVLALLFYFMRLTVRVTEDELQIRFFPFARRRVALAEIEECKPLTYRPLLDAGGWGMHYSFTGYGWAYNVYGRRGVAIGLKNGKRLLIGSQRADELAAALCGA